MIRDNCYDVAVEQGMLPCANTLCSLQPKAVGADYAEVEISSGFTLHGSQVMYL